MKFLPYLLMLCPVGVLDSPADGQDEPAEAGKKATPIEEANARKRLSTARRLVLRQRWDRLGELIEKYPNTTAAAEARGLRESLMAEYDRRARRKLSEALRAPLVFDQRWRRLKEIVRDHAGTQSAEVAQQIFDEHAARIPPVVITNEIETSVTFTVDTPYEVLQEVTLEPGKQQSFPSAFPLSVRIRTNQNEWNVFGCRASLSYALKTSPADTPALYYTSAPR